MKDCAVFGVRSCMVEDCAVKPGGRRRKIYEIRYNDYVAMYRELQEKEILKMENILAPSILSADLKFWENRSNRQKSRRKIYTF